MVKKNKNSNMQEIFDWLKEDALKRQAEGEKRIAEILIDLNLRLVVDFAHPVENTAVGLIKVVANAPQIQVKKE